ncbi:MAG: DEAD/DEAH box helicase [Candidatus Pacebacteria bacterium]|nr:DEAD/DEAH box helicase [Candidatus Paceibacterota bacterium]
MYQKNSSFSRSRSSSASGPRSPARSGSFFARPPRGGQRGNFRSSPRSGPRGRAFGGQYIDPSRFINKVTVTEEMEHFVPEHKFQDFLIGENLKQGIVSKGYVTPTPIQDRAIPQVLKGLDVVGIANTGTGKTAAFLVPLLNKVLLDRKQQVLVVVPTRELAIQIDDELKGFVQHTKDCKIFSVCCVGGANIRQQISQLRYQYNFIIGTPGRLKDLIDRKMIKLPEFDTIVLDEADRMLDMGFIKDMRAIMAGMPKSHQTLFFSATLSPEIEGLIKEFLRDPVRISVKTRDTAKNVEQDVVRVGQGGNKFDILDGLLNQKDFSKVLIFGRTKHGVEKLSQALMQRGLKAESIHGNKNHSQRQRALKMFKDNTLQILVATDVAARGLDIPDVSHVINFDIPATYEDYVHRIGRTGRANKRGKAITFID